MKHQAISGRRMACGERSALGHVKFMLVGALLSLATVVSPAVAVGGRGHWRGKGGMHKGMRGMHGSGKGMHKGRGTIPFKRIITSPFGAFEGQKVTLYTLRMGKVSVGITDFGATLVSVRVPGRRGRAADVIAGFSYSANYSSTNYGNLGCVIGRYGNRIGGHSFTIGGRLYNLDANAGNNTIHGGFHSFCFKLWKAKPTWGPDFLSLTLTLTSPDGEGGFPGNLMVSAKYTLRATGKLELTMEATTDKPTHINLVHHPYFNLNGQPLGANLTASARNHVVQIYASKYTPKGPGSVPFGEITSVRGTVFDFLTPKVLGSVIDVAGGYDINFVLDIPQGKPLWPAVLLRDPRSGRSLKIYTNQPGLQFYSGNWLNVVGKGGVKYTPQSFLAFEAQKFPNTPNIPNFPTTLVTPGQKYRSTVVYEFSTYR